jgi:outer membrane protein assembly factor BamD (BamD/ComL family)
MRSAHSILSLALVAALASSASAGDIIVLHSGKTMGKSSASDPPTTADFEASKITVIEENVDEIRYRLAGVSDLQGVKTASVREVYHDPEAIPGELRSGLRNLDTFQFDAARDALGKVASSRSAAPWARDRAAFEIARSYWYEGNLDETVKAMQAFKNAHAKSRLTGNATRIVARAYLAAGKPAEARKAFESIKRIAGISESEVFEAEYYIANIDEQLGTVNPAAPDKKRIKQARAAYSELYNKLQGKPAMTRIRGLCTVGMASCDIALGDHASAKPRLLKLIDSQKGGARDDLVLAGAYTRLGNVLLAENATANDPAVYRQAQRHFLRVVTLYGDAEAADGYMAESLYRTGELFTVLRPAKSDDPDVKKQRSEYRRRARRELEECVKRYGNSAWGQRAKAALAALK